MRLSFIILLYNDSLVCLSGNDVFWEQVFPIANTFSSESASKQVFSFVDHQASLLEKQNEDFVFFSGLFVSFANLSDDKVHKDDACYCADDEEQNPVDGVLELGQKLSCIEVVVTERHAEHCEHLS